MPGFRPQSFGQWLATFSGCLRSHLAGGRGAFNKGYVESVMGDLDDGAIRKLHKKGLRPSDAARQYEPDIPHHADPERPAKKVNRRHSLN